MVKTRTIIIKLEPSHSKLVLSHTIESKRFLMSLRIFAEIFERSFLLRCFVRLIFKKNLEFLHFPLYIKTLAQPIFLKMIFRNFSRINLQNNIGTSVFSPFFLYFYSQLIPSMEWIAETLTMILRFLLRDFCQWSSVAIDMGVCEC